MNKYFKTFFFTSFAMIIPAIAFATDIYVSPNAMLGGNGSIDAPYNTIEQAKTAVRSMTSNMSEDIVVYLDGGEYVLDSTLAFSPLDSGQNGYNVIYMAKSGETPVISGGKRITGWQLYDSEKNIWCADSKGLYSRNLYVNGVRATRARTNTSAEIPRDIKKTSTGYSLDQNNSLLSLQNIEKVEFVYKKNWMHQRMGVARVDENNIIMDNGFKNLADPVAIDWIENAYELLDTPGEWYMDEDIIYYMPRTNEDIANANVILPVLENLVTGTGEYTNSTGVTKTIHNIEFSGISFMYTTWYGVECDDGYVAVQGGFGVDSVYDNKTYGLKQAFRLDCATDVIINNCTFSKLGCGAIRFGVGTKRVKITNNEVYDISGGGIYVEEKQRSWADDKKTFTLCDNEIFSNSVHDIGREYQSSVGIFVGYGENITVSHNEVYNAPYTGISIGWGWDDLGNSAVYKTDSINKNNKIYNNLVHDVMRTMLDGGGIYNLGAQPGMEIQNNVVYNVSGYDGAAYYLDDGSQFVVMRNNVGYNCNIILYPKGRYNTIIDNYFDNNYTNSSIIGFQNEPRGVGSEINNKVVLDNSYPIDIMENAGLNRMRINIRGNAGTEFAGSEIVYGLFKSTGCETSDDIAFIDRAYVDDLGEYKLTFAVALRDISSYTVKTNKSQDVAETDTYETINTAHPSFYKIFEGESSKLNDITNVKTAFSGLNSSEGAVYIIIGIYDDSMKLLEIQQRRIEDYSCAYESFDFSTESYNKIKIMLWSSNGGMMPLCESFNVPISQ